MKTKKNKFCKIYNEFFEEEIKEPEHLILKTIKGNDLYRFCEFYFSERLDESELQHFYSNRKSIYILIGLVIGIAVALLLLIIL
ncbi:hypothetical protein [Flavobacterium sp. HNIBRBA15423]|uniref:hypothetical protein n=1 Tax=Flavobacterium sp. HNIBRBA15423 TaxID=3458683 RepID=UPI0040442E0B